MIKAAICEDSKADRSVLARIVAYLMQERNLEFEITEYGAGEKLLDGYENHPYDLVFLDIMLGSLDGIEVGRQIRSLDANVEIVYCTSSRDFAIAAYEIHAMGYLLKPYEPARIGALLDYYTQKHPQKNRQYIEVRSNRRTVLIAYKDILYMESDNKVVYIHTTTQGDVKVYSRLDLIAQEMPDTRFLRCHQSYFVNLQYVAGQTGSDFIMMDDSVIPIRKNGRKLIIKRYEEYLRATL